MKRQFSLLMALSLGVGATVFACGDDETETTPTGTATVTGTGTGTGTATTTGTGTATGAGTTTGTGTATGGGTSTGTGTVCQDNDNAAWQGGGPGCYSQGGAGGVQLPGPTTGDAPNSQDNARYLGMIEDSDDCGATIQGVLSGNGDEDWYWYKGEDTFGALVSPSRDRGSDQDVVVCTYVQCADGDIPDVTCTDSAQDTLGSGGGALNGCCTDGDETVFDVDFDCSIFGAGDDSADMYIQVSGAELQPTDCVNYSIDFYF